MTRQTTFTVDAESVQDNPGATATFKAITIGQRRAYLKDPELDDIDMLRAHLVAWTGFVDDAGNELPNPQDEPAVIDALYMAEMRALSRLMWRPDGADAKN